MLPLPIALRELEVASRRLSSWLLRWLAAGLAVLIGGIWLLASYFQDTPMQGNIFFAVLSWSAFIYCLLAGLWTTTDALTKEKKEGTLGLLFLTDLRGVDVVLGKMVSASLRTFYGVMAILPVMALPLMMGGVTSAQFWMTIGVMMNTLLLSLSLGMFFSATCRGWRAAVLWTFFVILTVNLAPLVSGWIPGNETLFMDVRQFSPGFAFQNATTGGGSGPADWFWHWMAGCQVAVWSCLLLASWITPHSWQEKSRPTILPRTANNFTPPINRSHPKMLDVNPVGWLIYRDRSFLISKRIWMTLFLTALVLSILYVALTIDHLAWETFGSGILWNTLISWVFAIGIRLELARHVCKTIFDARASGALEQILVSPLGANNFRKGHFVGMLRFWRTPVISVVVIQLGMTLAGVTLATTEDPGFVVIPLLLGVLSLLWVIDLFALYYAGFWFSVRSTSMAAAFWKTFGFVYLLPNVASLFLCGIGFVTIVTNIVFIAWPLTMLSSHLHRVVSGEYPSHRTGNR